MFKNLLKSALETVKKGARVVACAVAAVVGMSLAPQQAQAAIVLTDFTTALGEVGTAVTGSLGATVTAGLAIAGVIMGGLLLWKLFKKIASA